MHVEMVTNKLSDRYSLNVIFVSLYSKIKKIGFVIMKKEYKKINYFDNLQVKRNNLNKT